MVTQKTLAVLCVAFPDGAEQVVHVSQPSFDIGRVPSNDLLLPDSRVSRLHARLLLEGECLSVIDLNSRNGTWVGGARLAPNEPHTLAYGEAVQIGPYTLRLQPAPQVAAREGLEPAAPPEPRPAWASAPASDSHAGREVRIGAAAAPPLPPSPPEPPAPPPGQSLPAYDEALGFPPDVSRYLRYLPPLYHEHSFVGRFLLAFEAIVAPIEQVVDNFDLYLDPDTASAFFLDQLAGWLGHTLDEKWPLDKRRALLAEAAELYRRRGTRWSLGRHLEIYTGLTPEIVEPDDQPYHFRVVLRVPPGQRVDRTTIERIIQANKPAHTTYALEILSK